MTLKKYKYESDKLGLIILCRLSDTEFAAAGAEPGGSVDAALTAYSSGSRRRHGVHTRGVTLSRVVGTAPNQFTKSKFLTKLTIAAFDSAEVGSSVTVGGVAWTVSGKVDEKLT